MDTVVKDQDISIVQQGWVVWVCQLAYPPSPFNITCAFIDKSNSISPAEGGQDITVGKNKASVGVSPFATGAQGTDNVHRGVKVLIAQPFPDHFTSRSNLLEGISPYHSLTLGSGKPALDPDSNVMRY
ncbi:hypothetical protein ES707_21355 [subsurface metagenome]